MKRFFGLFLMLLMFVGVSTATPSLDNLGEQTVLTVPQSTIVIEQAVLTVPQNAEFEVLDYISDWVGDNFSSENVENALLPNTMDIFTIKRKGGVCSLKGIDIPFDLLLVYKDNDINIKVFEKDKPLSIADKQLAHTVIVAFERDLDLWLNRMRK